MERLTFRYIAGFFDAEGSVLFTRQKSRINKRGYSIHYGLSITNTNYGILTLIKKKLKLTSKISKAGIPIRSQKQVYHILIESREKILYFLKTVGDYLVIKKKKCDFIKEYLTHRPDYKHQQINTKDMERLFDSFKNIGLNYIVPEISDDYLAGLFDGDGYLFFDRITNRYRTNKNRIKCSIGISDNTSNLLSYISEKYKSHFIRGVNSSSLVIEHREHLLKFLQSIAPYSHVFKRRISVVIKFLERRMKLGKGYTYTQIDFDYVNLFKKVRLQEDYGWR